MGLAAHIKRPLVAHPTISGAMLVPLTKGLSAIIDAQDADVVGRHNWFALAAKKAATNYARTNVRRPDGTRSTLLLHVLIWDHSGRPSPPQIDHESTDGLDCRRSNLRAATQSQNQHNRKAYRTNTSGIKGVGRNPGKGKPWKVYLRVNGKGIAGGYYDSKEEAAAARVALVRKYHGEFGRTA